MLSKIILFVILANVVNGFLELTSPNTAFDEELYESVLDADLCRQQVRYIRRTPLLNLRFADAGIRIPRGIFTGGSVDLGNYHQCLGIDVDTEEFDIQGKYCMIRLPINQSFHLPWNEEFDFNQEVNYETRTIIDDFNRLKAGIKSLDEENEEDENDEDGSTPAIPLSDIFLRLSVCIPKPCSTQQAMTSYLFNLTVIGFRYDDVFCRLPDDKPWVTADLVATIVFSIIGVLTILSTSYDLHHIFIRKKDPKHANKLCQSFSVYTNGRRLLTFSSNSDTLHCLDGIKALALLFVIALHTLVTENYVANPIDVIPLIISWKVLWITSAPVAADTFFTIAGLLVVYTLAGKVTGSKLLMSLHYFYLKRILRIIPILATVVLLQASFFNRMFDGPYWTTVGMHTHRCREFWWATLLHVQNYVTPKNMCLDHSWYLAIDVQLYILSPLVLFWVLSCRKMTAWFVLTGSLLAVTIASTVFNMTHNFPGGIFRVNRFEDTPNYMTNYYYNTLTRASPFFVGMIYGYLLHIWKGRRPKINVLIVLLLWICSLAIFGLIFYTVYLIKQFEWDNQVVDDLVGSFASTGWAIALGWVIFACVHGYSGPINWFLSLNIWKLPSRLTLAMYLLHYPLQYMINSTELAPTYINILGLVMKFAAYYALTLIVSFFVTLVINGPFSVLFGLLLGNGYKKQDTNNYLDSIGQLTTIKEDVNVKEE